MRGSSVASLHARLHCSTGVREKFDRLLMARTELLKGHREWVYPDFVMRKRVDGNIHLSPS